MAITNHERVGKALELLKNGLGPFVEREMTSIYKERAVSETSRFMGEDRLNAKKPVADWDVASGRYQSRPNLPQTSGRCIWARVRTNTGTRWSFSAAPISPRA